VSEQIPQLLTPLVAEVAAAIGALVKATADVKPAEMGTGRQWLAALDVRGAMPGTCMLVIDAAGASRLTSLVSGGSGDPDEIAVGELLRRVTTEALAALAVRQAGEQSDLSLVALEPVDDWSPREGALVCAIAVPGLTTPLVVAASLEAGSATEASDLRPGAAEDVSSRIDVILDIDLPVVVRFGHTELPIRVLSRLGPGSVIDLGRSPDDPVEVLVSNRVVARGEVVIVGGNYGVRITDVASRSERARSMEA
jgi:flagellar motor switch protein FliN